MSSTESHVSAMMRLFSEAYTLLHRRREADEIHLTPEGRALLMHLAWSGPLTIGDLAQHADRAQSVISDSVAVLESHGLAERVRDPRDRRRTLVWITERAQQWLSREREPLDRQRTEAVLASMSPTQRNHLIESFACFIEVAERFRDEELKRSRAEVTTHQPKPSTQK